MKTIAVIGGDNRSEYLAAVLKNDGCTVKTVGLQKENDDISDADIIVLPIPSTRDGKTVFAPLSKTQIKISDILKNAENKLILTCNYSPENVNFIDYGKSDEFAFLNAVPTAEGTIEYIIANTEKTVWKSKILLIGYGKTGKVLADRLKSLGAYITVSARKQKDFLFAKACGIPFIDSTKPLAGKYDIIINTADAPVFSEDEIFSSQAALFIDLASKSSVDLEKLKKYGISAVKLPSLPNKTAPKTAAEIFTETIKSILKDRGNSYGKN